MFDADAHDQRELFHQFRDIWSEVETTIGGSMIVIFHTTVETSRRYSEIVSRDLEQRRKSDEVTTSPLSPRNRKRQ